MACHNEEKEQQGYVSGDIPSDWNGCGRCLLACRPLQSGHQS
ncbi:unnamed protein product [Strongylus vulgaris]|uniref:Uncharacterized protein n=1 Tax=Strongylus vulgaris TaxID=40348 RepID=A0A3P7JAZ9_STRVU|nr:unnamed protein product [Strongylus vulgaris]